MARPLRALVLIVCTAGLGGALTAAGQGQASIAAVSGDSLHQAPPPAAKRPTNRPDQKDVVKDVADQFKGTHDIAGAAEALINAAGSQFHYDYGSATDPNRRDFAAISNLDQFYSQRLMICYEFVHYAGYLASNQTMAGNNPRMGAAPGNVYSWRKYDVWDGESEIPRGKIVVFRAYMFNNNSGYYHVGISLGGGKIAHNSSSGNMQISDISEVNSIGYSEVRIGDYDWRAAGDRNPGDPPPETVPEERVETYIRHTPRVSQALDTAPGLRVADESTCCGDPLGAELTVPDLNVTPNYQLFITGAPVDVPVGGDGSGQQDDDPVAARAPLDSALGLLAWLVRGAVAALEARQGPSRLGVAVVATGASTGDAFVLQVQGSSGRVFAADGLVLEPTTKMVAMPRAAAGRVVAPLDGFCAEFAKEPPPAGTVYRVAPAKQQQRFKPMRQIVRKVNELAEAGKLHPDSAPAGYFNFVKQYALWTRLEGWNRDEFFRHFVERTRKNAAAVKQPWTATVEQQVKALLPGRWADIQAVLQAIDAERR